PAPQRVMSRPCLSALCSYIFALRTRTCLDVMVWSFARPQNVEDMLLHTIHRHAWADPAPQPSASPTHSPCASPTSKSKPKLQPSSTWKGHSAAWTMLLDDSHAKAARQPYNHLCVLEYT
ncbi:hypothetical protein BJV74DRAFT_722517, partial [Russula compacta]